MSCPQKTGTARGGSRSLRFVCGFLWGLFCSIRRLTAIVSHLAVSPTVAYTKGRYTLGAVGQENAAVTTLDLTAQSGSLGCRLGCCLPVADVQHRPTRQRRPSAERCPLGTSAPRRGFLTENSPLDYFPALADAIRPWGRCPFSTAASVKRWTVPTGHQRPCQLSFEKAGQRTSPVPAAHVRKSLDEHERSELP